MGKTKSVKGKEKADEESYDIGARYSLYFSDPVMIDRFQSLENRQIIGGRDVNFDSLELIGKFEEFSELCNTLFGDTYFAKIKETIYTNHVYQFFTTLDIKENGDMNFTLKGKPKSLSVAELGHVFKIKHSGYTSIPENWSAHEAWYTFTGESIYVASNEKSTKIKDVPIRILHRFLSYSIFARGGSNSNVTRRELFALWCALEKKKFNCARFLAETFKEQSKKVKGKLMLGMYVTSIVKYFNMLSEEDKDFKVKHEERDNIGINSFREMGIAVKRFNKWELIEPPMTDDDDDVQEIFSDSDAFQDSPFQTRKRSRNTSSPHDSTSSNDKFDQLIKRFDNFEKSVNNSLDLHQQLERHRSEILSEKLDCIELQMKAEFKKIEERLDRQERNNREMFHALRQLIINSHSSPAPPDA